MENLMKKQSAQKQYRLAGLILCLNALALLVLRVAVKYISLGLESVVSDEWNEIIIDMAFTVILQLGVMTLMTFLMHGLAMKKSPKKLLRQSYFRKPRWWMIVFSIVMGCFVLFATMGFSTIWQLVLMMTGFMPSSQVATPPSSPAMAIFGFVMSLVLTGILPAIGEEFMYRGINLYSIEKHGGFWRAVFLSAALFGMGHVFIQQSFYTFMLGVLSGYMTVKFRNILPAMIIHCMNNSMSVYLDYATTNNLFGHQIFDFIYSNDTLGGLLLLGVLWTAVVGVIVGILFVMKHFHKRDQLNKKATLDQLKENSAEGNLNLEQASQDQQQQIFFGQPQNPMQGQPNPYYGQQNPYGQPNPYYGQPYPFVPQRKKPKKLFSNFDIMDNIFYICAFVLMIVGTLSTYIAGFLF